MSRLKVREAAPEIHTPGGQIWRRSRWLRVLGVHLATFVPGRHQVRAVWHAARLLAERPGTDIEVERADGPTFRLPGADPYWFRLVSDRYEYEPELRRLIEAIPDIDYFVDCGANIGYWSSMVAWSRPSAKVVAIEPNPVVRRYIETTREANSLTFEIDERAVSGRSGEHVEFAVPRGASAGGHIDNAYLGEQMARTTEVDEDRFWVSTVSLQDLLAGHVAASDMVVVKLDVEGAEVDIVNATPALREGHVLLVYEDHGRDRTSQVTGHLQHLGFRTALLTESGVVAVESAQAASALKPEKGRGYNFIAWMPDSPWVAALALIDP